MAKQLKEIRLKVKKEWMEKIRVKRKERGEELGRKVSQTEYLLELIRWEAER